MHFTFQLVEFLVQNSLSVPTQVFQECWSWHFGFKLVWSTPLPLENWADLGTLDLSWSGVPPKMKIWADLDTLDLSWSGVPPPPKNWADLGTLDLS